MPAAPTSTGDQRLLEHNQELQLELEQLQSTVQALRERLLPALDALAGSLQGRSRA